MDHNLLDSIEGFPEALTDRELEILVCLADGLSNKEIAKKLFLAEQTVRWYNSQIYSKLGVSSRQEAVDRAHALGLFRETIQIPEIVGKHNLPTQATPFVGREHELGELNTLLKDNHTRLVTILAPGGMGKTRLALEAARLQIGYYADGVIFVPLAPLGNANDIVTTIAENIGFIFYGEHSPAQQLTDFLRDRSMLLVLDNFEHLMDGAQLVADLIQAAPNIRIITTSRERLNLRGETVYTLRSLEFPTWETPEDALQYDAVKLFMQSAHHVRADFTLQTHDLDYLARICRLTAGLPLGIELAAGWVDVLSLEQIAAEIQQGIDILETDMRDVPERQRSIRATFSYSWERLTNDEQAVFMRLSVFRGGFTVQAAVVVASASVRSLKQLTNKALVQVSLDGRHDIHELLRQFGAEKLALSGEQTDIQAKHAAYFADFMAERKQDIRTNRQLEALQLIDPDFENVRSAWLHVVHRQEWDQLPKFLYSLWFYLDKRTRGREGVNLLENAIKVLQSASNSDTTQLALGRVLARLGWFYNDIGFLEKGAEISDEAIRILGLHNSTEDLLAGLLSRRLNAGFLNQVEIAVNISKEGLDIAKLNGDKNSEGYFQILSGGANIMKGDLEAALHFVEVGKTILEELGDQWGVMRAYFVLGYIKMCELHYTEAEQWLDKALSIAHNFNHSFEIASIYTVQGRICLAKDNNLAARLKFGKSLRTYWDAGYQWAIPVLIAYIAQNIANENEPDRAVELLATIYQQTYNDLLVQELRNQLETKLESDRFASAWARGERRTLSEIVTRLLSEFEDH